MSTNDLFGNLRGQNLQTDGNLLRDERNFPNAGKASRAADSLKRVGREMTKLMPFAIEG